MAYINQDTKKKIQPKITQICKKYGVKASLSISHNTKLVCTIAQGKLDFGGNIIQVNPYWLKENYNGKTLEFLEELKNALNEGNHNNSNIQADYFDVGWYVDINVGKWNKPYIQLQ